MPRNNLKVLFNILGATSRIILIGGFKHECYFPFHIWDVILSIDELICFKIVIASPTSCSWMSPQMGNSWANAYLPVMSEMIPANQGSSRISELPNLYIYIYIYTTTRFFQILLVNSYSCIFSLSISGTLYIYIYIYVYI